MAKLNLPSLLNYTRSIVPSNGVFKSTSSESENAEWVPIAIQEQTVRGTISNYGDLKEEKDPNKTTENVEKKLRPENANIQTIDVCFLPAEHDRFQVSFSVNFLGNALAPTTCNNEAFTQALVAFGNRFKEANGFAALAECYLTNLVNARWMWRNRYAVDKEVTIEVDKDSFVFPVENAFTLNLKSETAKSFNALRDKIALALSSNSKTLQMSVRGEGTLGYGQEVYPSQRFVDKKGKFLAHVERDGVKQAIMHSQKIGNAIRTIDTWYPDFTEELGPLPIEPYGVLQKQAKAYRLPNSKNDFYSHLKNLEQVTSEIKDTTPGETALYVMACLIRGGVFSGDKEKK